MTKNYKYHPYIDNYMAAIDNGKIPACVELKQAMPYIRKKLDNPDVFIDSDKIYKAAELIEKYFEYTLLDWELFVIALTHCYYKTSDTVVFNRFFIMMGRGNGKNGFISGLAWYLTTPNHGIKSYNVDIIANSEDQAETSFNDIYDMLDGRWDKMKRFYYKSKEVIIGLKTKSYIKFNTSNARTKDGKRSACLIFDEKHEYENSKMIGVFRSGFGKKKHSRIYDITTNGDVRDGVLDEDLRLMGDILKGGITELGVCPLIYKLDDDNEAHNLEMWHKANPSLKYFPELKKEMDSEFVEMKYNKTVELNFFTKRMNMPRSNSEIAVTDYEKNIKPTNKPLPDMTGWSCTVGIDYAAINDFASVNFHFKRGDDRYDINHSWLCLKSNDLHRIKPDWQRWADDKLITLVDDVSIHPRLIAEYIASMAIKYNIKMLAMDNNRYALVSEELKKIGFDAAERKNIKLVRPNDIYKVQTVINDCFIRHLFAWGDNPVLRWAVNNTKLLSAGKKEGTETGNYYYGKIEPKSRKTDPFMALVHSMVVEDVLTDTTEMHDIPVIIGGM